MPLQEIPQVPEQNPNQNELVLNPVINPFHSVWWSTQTVTQVPENVMGWLVAQGYEVTGITQDTTTVPPTNYFALTREGMKPLEVLLSLCNSYTIAANEARGANQIRYNEVVSNWAQMIDTSHDQFNAQTDEQNVQAGIFLTDLDEYMTAVETLIDDNRSQMVVDAAESKVALEAMDARLADLETNAAANAVTIGTLLTEQDTNLSTYISDYDSKLAEMDANAVAHIAAVLAEAGGLETVLESHVTAYSAQFDLLATNYSAHLVDIDALLANVASNVTTYVTDVATILTALDSDYQTVSADLGAIKTSAGTLGSNFAIDYQLILDQLEGDYTTHESLSRGFLVDLGSTETARINEEYAAKLSVQLQQLVTNGLSASTLITDITERNHRNRDEQIQAHNDQLMREKLANQHQLYQQQFGMRTRMMDAQTQLHSVRQEVLKYQASLISGVHGLLQEVRNRTLAGKQAILAAKDANERLGIEVQSQLYAKLQDIRQRTIESLDRIYQLRDVYAKWSVTETHKRYEQLQQVEQLFVECIQRQLAAKQDVTKGEMSQRDTLLQQLQSALTALLGGKERFSTLLLQIASKLAEHKNKAIAERLDTAVKRLEGWKSVADDNRRLMAMQLDERNKLLIGLYSFVERRNDLSPEWKDQAAMIASLGDSSGGWVTP